MTWGSNKTSCGSICDSMSVIHLAKNQVYHARTKHIDVKYHFVWDVLEDGYIEVKKIRIKDNLTDMFTKVVLESSLIIAKTCSESFWFLKLGGAHCDELREA